MILWHVLWENKVPPYKKLIFGAKINQSSIIITFGTNTMGFHYLLKIEIIVAEFGIEITHYDIYVAL